jgi:hypothetical protein
MSDFVFLYAGGGDMPADEAGKAAVFKAWDDWFHAIGTGLKDGGNPFAPAARTVAADGSVGDASGTAHTGYSIVTADSLEEATAIAKGSPVLTGGGTVSVYEVVPAM